MNTLNDLLNQEVIDNPDQWFESVCKILFYRTVFHIKDQRYKITEAELYLNSKEHPDVFTHGSDDQKESGLFYFHKQGRGGIDITFGNESRHGGILLRGMQNLDEKSDYIDGPVLLSRRIVKNLGGKENKVSKGTPKLSIDIFEHEDLWLEEISGEDQIIYKAPRRGLSLLKEVEARLPYIAKPYRYLAIPLKTKNW